MKFHRSAPSTLTLQLAPLLDVVFLLLIFFVVTQAFILTEQDLDVKVPTADEGKKNDSRALNEIIINVRQDGTVTINREVIPLSELEGRVKRLAMAGGEVTPILIRGDGKCEYENIIAVVNVCLKAKIYNIRFSTQKPKPSQPVGG